MYRGVDLLCRKMGNSFYKDRQFRVLNLLVSKFLRTCLFRDPKPPFSRIPGSAPVICGSWEGQGVDQSSGGQWRFLWRSMAVSLEVNGGFSGGQWWFLWRSMAVSLEVNGGFSGGQWRFLCSERFQCEKIYEDVRQGR